MRWLFEDAALLFGTEVAEVLGPRLFGAAASSGSDSDDPLKKKNLLMSIPLSLIIRKKEDNKNYFIYNLVSHETNTVIQS